MEAPPLKGEIGSLEALTAKGVPRDLTPELDVHLLDAAMWFIQRDARCDSGRALPAVQKGRTALHLAASNGQYEIVSYICVVPGINVNVQDQFGFTPLHLTAHSPNHDDQRACVIKEVLNVKNINPNSVMDGKFHDAADFQGSRITVLHLAVRGKFKDAVDLLLAWRPKQGDETIIDVGLRWPWGFTPLHLAIRGMNVPII
ncbi:unnamed protein product [Sphagnum troendelagicum]|uniref:Uncharacterized protein n=1 Tax=Sphagnum troendelagicum TaxID=128251 RepID=A0ABP0U3B2_9BRYO